MARGKAKQPGNSPLSPGASRRRSAAGRSGRRDRRGHRPVHGKWAIDAGLPDCVQGVASPGLTNRLDGWLGADPASGVPGGEPALPPYASIFLILGAVSVVTWLAGAAWMARRQHISFAAAAASWGLRGWFWWLVGGSWELARLVTFAAGSEGMQQFVLSSPSFWIAAGVAGWVATFLALAFRRPATGAAVAIGAATRSETTDAPGARSGLLVPAADGYPCRWPFGCASRLTWSSSSP